MLTGCNTTQIAPNYDIEYVFNKIHEIDMLHNTSFLKEKIEKPIREDKITDMLSEIEKLEQNNDNMNYSKDYNDIKVLLEFRKYLLLGQLNYNIYFNNFNGGYNCQTALQDYHAVEYLEKAANMGVRVNSRIDKLITENNVARRIVIGEKRPAFYDSDYGKLNLDASDYKKFLRTKCGFNQN